MANFENTLRSTALAILKRELTEAERVELLELGVTIGIGNVEDYLYMLMAFKRSEDNINGQILAFKKEMKARFEEMGALEKKIDSTLKRTLEDMLGKGAEKIGYAMGRDIVDSAQQILKANGDYHFLRGQVVTVCVTALMATVAYWLGGTGIFDNYEGRSYFSAFLWFPAGGLAIMCGLVYMFLWYSDYEWQIDAYTSYKISLMLQICAFLALLLRLLI